MIRQVDMAASYTAPTSSVAPKTETSERVNNRNTANNASVAKGTGENQKPGQILAVNTLGNARNMLDQNWIIAIQGQEEIIEEEELQETEEEEIDPETGQPKAEGKIRRVRSRFRNPQDPFDPHVDYKV